jgi:hypothetical protein
MAVTANETTSLPLQILSKKNPMTDSEEEEIVFSTPIAFTPRKESDPLTAFLPRPETTYNSDSENDRAAQPANKDPDDSDSKDSDDGRELEEETFYKYGNTKWKASRDVVNSHRRGVSNEKSGTKESQAHTNGKKTLLTHCQPVIML